MPLIVHWQGVTQPGSASDVPVITMDLFPTIVEMAGLKAPANGPVPGGPGGLGNLGGLGGGLPEGLSAENLAEQLSKMPSNLNFPPPNQGPQGNIPAAFRGGGKRKKK